MTKDDTRLQALKDAIAKTRQELGIAQEAERILEHRIIGIDPFAPEARMISQEDDKPSEGARAIADGAGELAMNIATEAGSKALSCALDALQPAYRTGGKLDSDRFSSGVMENTGESFSTECDVSADVFRTAESDVPDVSLDATAEAGSAILDAVGSVLGGLLDGLSF